MAQELPYLGSYKNVETLFNKIAAAKQPDAFTTRYLADTLGIKSAGDRQLIGLLKNLNFLDAGGRPTTAYSNLKNPKLAKLAIANSIREAYEPLFAANEKVYQLSPQELNGVVSQVAGSDSGMTSKIAGTFRALSKVADFEGSLPKLPTDKDEDPATEEDGARTHRAKAKLSPEFHYNIQIHLPTNATEETYLNIFNALRKSFQ
jgi:hypothetical protein